MRAHAPNSCPVLEPTRAIVPPEIERRIRAYYGRRMRCGEISRRALEPFWRRYKEDRVFHDRMMRTSKRLSDAVFDPESPSWGIWPIDIEECAGLGLILGKLFEGIAESIVLRLPEKELAQLEQESRAGSKSLCDLLFQRLSACKETAGRDTEPEAGTA
jgi:hypothetical protein